MPKTHRRAGNACPPRRLVRLANSLSRDQTSVRSRKYLHKVSVAWRRSSLRLQSRQRVWHWHWSFARRRRFQQLRSLRPVVVLQLTFPTLRGRNAVYRYQPSTGTNALASCGTDQYVQLGSGTFNLSTVITFPMETAGHKALRGANSTFLVFTGAASTAIVLG